jgi:hypothetical protein
MKQVMKTLWNKEVDHLIQGFFGLRADSNQRKQTFSFGFLFSDVLFSSSYCRTLGAYLGHSMVGLKTTDN